MKVEKKADHEFANIARKRVLISDSVEQGIVALLCLHLGYLGRLIKSHEPYGDFRSMEECTVQHCEISARSCSAGSDSISNG